MSGSVGLLTHLHGLCDNPQRKLVLVRSPCGDSWDRGSTDNVEGVREKIRLVLLNKVWFIEAGLVFSARAER